MLSTVEAVKYCGVIMNRDTIEYCRGYLVLWRDGISTVEVVQYYGGISSVLSRQYPQCLPLWFLSIEKIVKKRVIELKYK